jgi:hypothetical protein
MDPRFKPMKDAIHNQVSAGLLGPLAEYRDKLPLGMERTEIQGIIDQIQKLTSIDEKALEPQLAAIQDEALRGQLKALLPAPNAEPVDALSALAQLMLTARETVAAKKVSAADQRRLIDLDITAATVLSRRHGAGRVERRPHGEAGPADPAASPSHLRHGPLNTRGDAAMASCKRCSPGRIPDARSSAVVSSRPSAWWSGRRRMPPCPSPRSGRPGRT